MTDFKKDVPVDRTVVLGTWSDILDDWSHSFLTDDDGKTSQQVALHNISAVIHEFKALQISQLEVDSEILTEIKLLNKRFEFAFETNINREDL